MASTHFQSSEAQGPGGHLATPARVFPNGPKRRVHANSQTLRRSSSVEDFSQQMNLVVAKHFALWKSKESFSPEVESVARFSNEVNTTLAAMVHGETTDLFKLGLDFLRLGTFGWYRYWRDSRILERVSARLKAKIQAEV